MQIRKPLPPDHTLESLSPAEREAVLEHMRREWSFLPGNDRIYSLEETVPFEDSPLKGKRIIFLGSSVTEGTKSVKESFCDYLQKEDGIIPYKEAVAGTTLVDKDLRGPSYLKRMKTIPQDFAPDLFICQLSTNDSSLQMPLGQISEGKDYDPLTIAGAIETVITYAQATWNCPIMFYNGTKFQSEHYQAMVKILKEAKEKWGIGIIDLWNGIDLAEMEDTTYDLYMADPIHPTRAGYKLWWTPFFRQELVKFFASKA